MSVIKVVLTGGPCSGKTKTLDYIKKRLKEEGYNVVTIDETATQLINGRIYPKPSDYDYTINFQDLVLKLQYSKEKYIEDFLSKENKDFIIIYDRGILDNRAYLDSDSDFDKILKQNNLSEINITDKYDLVINLVSTAVSDNYEYEENGIRYESKSEAKSLDKKTVEAWLLSDRQKIIRPTKTIEEKQEKVYNLIMNIVNENEVIDNKLYESDIKILNSIKFNNVKQVINNEFIIDNNDDTYSMLSRRFYKGKNSYVKKKIKNLVDNKILLSRQITDECDYLKMLEQNNPLKASVKQETKFIDDDYNIIKFINENDKVYVESDSISKVKKYIK